jgi:CheY-like chemotaxis protein
MSDKHILIVDDDDDNIAFMKKIIQDAGYQVQAVTDSTQAMPSLLAQKPAMVFLDVQMPGLNGFQVLKEIRANTELAGLTVVLLSAIGAVTGQDYDPDMIEAQYGVRPDAFLPKGIAPQEIRAKIEEIMTLVQ